ncbi:Tfp pilus assembly protein PilF [Tistlia consotensis]|uniref:Tfp pilus assembly protein PilF n=1 Tax=Tistlia consotensis USBA 355 TaxID=560819 RepID=A0A1Y6B9Y1_9PROT|nr:tetratricopeptide repeat protein [Tistlia consotensis]SME96989.1 Tfp pilus assembly protein PilF [Tistlia consotensis USBA 355]SNR56408.1 Tfp pilus assembly protein PilF [Tistlia consotensis]
MAQSPPRSSILRQAAALLRDGAPGQAEVQLERHLRRRPEDAEALQLAGLAALGRGDATLAVERLEHAGRLAECASGAPDAALLTNLGAARAAAGDLEGALASLERACDRPPPSAAGFFNLGAVLRRLGRDARATEAFERALALEPRHRGARKGLAAALLDLGRWREALAMTEALLTGEPDSAELHFNAALAARALGRSEAALRHLDALPESAAAALERASCLQELGRWDEALADYRRAAAAEPGALAAVAKRMAAGARGRLAASPAALRLLLLGEA